MWAPLGPTAISSRSLSPDAEGATSLHGSEWQLGDYVREQIKETKQRPVRTVCAA